MLHTGRERRNLGENTLVRRAGHDLVWIPLGATIRCDDSDAWAEIFDEVPSSACDCEEIHVVVHIAENFQGGVVLEEQVHLDTYPTDILEHVGELHVFRIRAKTVEAGRVSALRT